MVFGNRGELFVMRSLPLPLAMAQGPEEICLSLGHQNPSKTSEIMGYFDRVTVSLHILYTANQETEGSQDRSLGLRYTECVTKL